MFSNLWEHRRVRCMGCGLPVDKTRMKYVCRNAGLCPDCVKNIEFTHARDTFFGTDNVEFVVSPLFYTKIVRKLLIDLKFGDNRINAEILNLIVEEFMRDFDIFRDFDMVVPVPLSKERFCERGFNQSDYLADCVSRLLGIPSEKNILFRVRDTERQSSLSRQEKIMNVKNAFTAADGAFGKNIIIADDICTTRSTVDACAKVLIDAGAERIAVITYSVRKPIEDNPLLIPTLPKPRKNR